MKKWMEKWDLSAVYKVFLVLLDIVFVNASSLLALWIRFNMYTADIPIEYYTSVKEMMIPNTVATLIVFAFFKLYTSLWRYASIKELVNIIESCAVCMLLNILGYYLTYGNDLSYSGYKYGPDSIVLALGGNYLTYNGGLDVFYTLMYRAHGEHGIKYTNEQNQKPESDLGADWSRDLKLSGTIEHTLLANVGLKYQIHKSFSISTALTYQYKINYNNVAGDWQNLQISIGCSFNPMNFF